MDVFNSHHDLTLYSSSYFSHLSRPQLSLSSSYTPQLFEGPCCPLRPCLFIGSVFSLQLYPTQLSDLDYLLVVLWGSPDSFDFRYGAPHLHFHCHLSCQAVLFAQLDKAQSVARILYSQMQTSVDICKVCFPMNELPLTAWMYLMHIL